ncbi:MAG: ABC transporter C-terminal domain-containing protein, partial [Microthrixaceae bacterium]
STLLDIMAGRIAPRSGSVEVGTTARIGYYDQRGRTLDPGQRDRDAVVGDGGVVDWTDTALMEAFWFDGDAQWAPIGLLSGGERRRLQLLLTLAERPNVLFLDEPTNDLDLDTLRQLESFLDDWPGALVVVSHDRAFLERTVADVIILDGEGSAGRRPGGYAAYEQERRATRGGRRLSPSGGATAADRATRDGGAASAGAPANGAASGASGRSPSTIRHELKAAEKALAATQRRHAELSTRLAELGSSGDHVRMAELGTELADVAAEMDAAEERWLELATEAEERGLKV